jgi:hypothetical protein
VAGRRRELAAAAPATVHIERPAARVPKRQIEGRIEERLSDQLGSGVTRQQDE